jgi:carbamoyl-phosphate synthase large subunit
MNILITSAGRRVSLVNAFKNELKALFPDGKVFTTDFNTSLAAACRVSDGAFQTPSVNDKNYIPFLLQLSIKDNVSLIIPTIDTQLLILSKHKKNFLKHGIHIIVSNQDFISICRDKRKTHEFFKSHQIPISKEYSKFDYELPLFIKPINGSRSIDNHVIREHEELTEYHFKNDNLMFLEYLDHDLYEEFTCDLYYDKQHKLKCVVPRKRIDVRDGEVCKGLAEKNQLISYIKKHLHEIPGAIGCLTSQFFKHKETHAIYGIEINARFGGGFPLTYLTGANYPRWLIQEYLLNETLSYFNGWEDRLLMLRYDSEILVHDYNQ